MARRKNHSDTKAVVGKYNKHVYKNNKKGKGNNKQHNKSKFKSTNGRDIRHRDQFKRLPPAPTEDEVRKKRVKRSVPESSESEEETDTYQLLVSSLSHGKVAPKVAVDSEDESEEDNEMLDDTEDKDQPNLQKEEDSEDESMEDSADEGETNDKESDDESESESEIEIEPDKDSDKKSSGSDPFIAHIHPDLSEEAVTLLSETKADLKCHELTWPKLGHLHVVIPDIPYKPPDQSKFKLLDEPTEYAKPGSVPKRIDSSKLDQYNIKSQVLPTIATTNSKFTLNSGDGGLTPLQTELFSLFNNYQDVYFPERTLDVGEEVRFAYCLHIANHTLKTRSACIHHNARLTKKEKEIVPDEYRDQGLVRPKALIVVPFRESGKRVVEMLISLLAPNEGKAGAVMNRKRFDDEFAGGELFMPKKNARPEDYETTFAGNTDDTFRIGLTITKKCVKLYADFYSSDIIVASPLGLRTIIGAEGESGRDFDFLASIEIFVLDQADVCFMQNWEHVLHLLDHMHLQPRESHGTDFARVRSWAANGLARFYRQSLVLSAMPLPQFSALFSKRCHNYAGSVRVVNPILRGTICKVVVQLPQMFQRIDAPSVSDSIEARFSHFTKKTLPHYSDSIMSHTLVYVPSYFDYVRIRNHFKRQDVSFVQICEYSKDNKIARARDMFYHSQVHYLLYSERFHFFRRPKVKGVRHIVFYQPPNQPHFYSEMCNLMQEANQNPHAGSESNMTVTVLYTKFDAPQLASIVGTERASRMVSSDQTVHMFMTGE